MNGPPIRFGVLRDSFDVEMFVEDLGDRLQDKYDDGLTMDPRDMEIGFHPRWDETEEDY
jgi:hypothetical protein